MKNLLKMFSVVLVLCLVCSAAFASWITPVNDVTKKMGLTPKGGLLTANSLPVPAATNIVSGNGESVTGVLVTSGATAGSVAVFDSPIYWNGSSYQMYDVAAECVFQADIAANTSAFYDFHNSPIQTKQGLYVTTSSANTNVEVYTQQ